MGKIKKSKLQSKIKEEIVSTLSEDDETMFVSTKSGDTKAVSMDQKNAKKIRRDPNVTSISTAKGRKIKEDLKAVSDDKLKETVKAMKSLAKKYKNASGEDKKKIKSQIQTLKPIKDELQSMIKEDDNQDYYGKIDNEVDDGDWVQLSQCVDKILSSTEFNNFGRGDVVDYICQRIKNEF